MPSHKWHPTAEPLASSDQAKMDAKTKLTATSRGHNGHKAIDDLPNELLAEIFLRCSGASLGKVRQVCKKWLDLLKQLDGQYHFWFNAALRDIPLTSLLDLGQQSFQELLMKNKITRPSDIPFTACIDWEDFHHRWVAINRPLSGVDFIQDCFPLNKRGWNVASSGNVLFAGISAGIYIIGERSDGSFVRKLLLKENVVESFALVDLLGRGTYTFKEGADEMLTARHHHIVSLKGSDGICAIPIAENSNNGSAAVLHSTGLSLQVCGDLAAVLQEGGIVSLWKLSYNPDRIEDKIKRDVYDRSIVDFAIQLECFYIVSHPTMRIKMFHLGLQQVTALSCCGKYVTFDLESKRLSRRPTELECGSNVYFLDGKPLDDGIFLVQTIMLQKSLCIKGKIMPLIPDMEARCILAAKKYCHIVAMYTSSKTAITNPQVPEPCLLELYDITTLESAGELTLICSLDMREHTDPFIALDIGLDLSNQLQVTLVFVGKMVRILFPRLI